ncbi:kelch domain-containing protein 8A [Ciona intestinalis]
MSLANGTWTSIGSLSGPRVYMSVVICDGSLYVVGGCDEMGQPVNFVEVYSAEEDTWTKLKSMHTKRAAPIVTAVEGRIVAIGGVGVAQAPVDAVEVFSVAENKWKKLTPLSEPLMGMAHFLRDNKVHIFGGMGIDTNPRDHFKCLVVGASAGGEKWQAFTPMPTARYAAQAFYKNSKAYVLGGRVGKLPVAVFEVYDFDSRIWVSYPEILSKRVFPCYAMTDKHIVSLGGLKQTAQQGFCDNCEIYSTEQNDKGEWQTNKRMSIPTKRGDFTAKAIDNQVLVAGGLGNNGKPLSAVELFDPETKKWKRLADLPRAHSTCASVVHQGKFYLIAGVTLEGPSATCEMFKVV